VPIETLQRGGILRVTEWREGFLEKFEFELGLEKGVRQDNYRWVKALLAGPCFPSLTIDPLPSLPSHGSL
jgi:hypothetical protein